MDDVVFLGVFSWFLALFSLFMFLWCLAYVWKQPWSQTNIYIYTYYIYYISLGWVMCIGKLGGNPGFHIGMYTVCIYLQFCIDICRKWHTICIGFGLHARELAHWFRSLQEGYCSLYLHVPRDTKANAALVWNFVRMAVETEGFTRCVSTWPGDRNYIYILGGYLVTCLLPKSMRSPISSHLPSLNFKSRMTMTKRLYPWFSPAILSLLVRTTGNSHQPQGKSFLSPETHVWGWNPKLFGNRIIRCDDVCW